MLLVAGLSATALVTRPSRAATASEAPKQAEAAEVPGEDIFGFTAPTDVGNEGDTGAASENTGRVGKRMGRFSTATSKLEVSRTVDPNTWGALSLFGSHYHVREIPDLELNRSAFDGASFEVKRRIVQRSVTNPFAVSLSVEPRWFRFDFMSGRRVEGLFAEAKVFVDSVIIPNKLFWAANLNYAPGAQQGLQPGSKWVSGAGTNVSTALTYAWSPEVFTGAEVRLLSAYNSAWLRRYAGSGLFLGPTFLWKVSDKLAINVVWTPQIRGRSATERTRELDLENFERHQFRVKIAVQF
jgi:hypothetical protein